MGFVESHPKRKDRDALRMGTLGWWVSLRKSGFPSGMTSKKGKNHADTRGVAVLILEAAGGVAWREGK